MFSIAAAFGNVHGVYKAGNVSLSPHLLKGHQEYAKQQLKCAEDKVDLFFLWVKLTDYNMKYEETIVIVLDIANLLPLTLDKFATKNSSPMTPPHPEIWNGMYM